MKEINTDALPPPEPAIGIINDSITPLHKVHYKHFNANHTTHDKHEEHCGVQKFTSTQSSHNAVKEPPRDRALEDVLLSTPTNQNAVKAELLVGKLQEELLAGETAQQGKWGDKTDKSNLQHMEVLMTWLARRQIRIAKFVNAPGRTWVQDTDTVYVPMNLDNKHWVGLAINISVGCIEVLDPNTDFLKTNQNLDKYLKPLLGMISYVVHKICPQTSQPKGPEPYAWKCIKDLYMNLRCRDCGPVAIKFMEMHAAGDPEPHKVGLTDEMVTYLRREYTLDLYKELIIPLYF
ncbi:unnamed protein product [Microthlaspi erraticum]|uniref:Ubiquitin-like protease family profile domain-containing protein n=1 Tax=Microthlaspi erraticum TaxID=1685480 RepID=A0A6D2IF39_9BRAS|nr:unnamed protein product [Microthlaspi erraticum]